MSDCVMAWDARQCADAQIEVDLVRVRGLGLAHGQDLARLRRELRAGLRLAVEQPLGEVPVPQHATMETP